MPRNDPIRLEVCVESAAGLEACKGLVDRVELCSGLALGGVTPSPALMGAAVESGLETHVLIRPRTGDFCYDAEELRTMRGDIRAVSDLGLQGVVIGAMRNDALDRPALEQMISVADGLTITLHRAFDVVADRDAALDLAVELGFQRILTSGGAPTAPEGKAEIRRLVDRAKDQIEIMAGSGITRKNVAEIITTTGVRHIHASCSETKPTAPKMRTLGFGDTTRRTNRDKIRQLRDVLTAQDN